jgi:mono/diheme cytochrome c family protein
MSSNKKRETKFRHQASAGLRRRSLLYCLLLLACCLLLSGCRQDMQDQPRYEVYESSNQFRDGLSSRPLVEGTVPRGFLRADTQLHTGKTGTAQTGGAQAGNANVNQSGQEAGSAEGANAAANGGANTQSGNSNATAQTGAASGAAAQARAGEDDDAADFPFPVTAEVMNRGQERYKIFCAMCHGDTGQGDGMIVRRGFRQPPTYHEDRLRQARVGYFFRVMTEGYGAMPPYRAQIPVQDRWAIAAYIRALQLSQMNQQSAPSGGAPTQPATGGHR